MHHTNLQFGMGLRVLRALPAAPLPSGSNIDTVQFRAEIQIQIQNILVTQVKPANKKKKTVHF